MASGLIRVNQTLACGAVDARDGIFERLHCGFLIFGANRLNHFLNEGAQGAALRHITLTTVF